MTPLASAQVISPVAMSSGPSGVDSIASYSFACFIFQKMLNVES